MMNHLLDGIENLNSANVGGSLQEWRGQALPKVKDQPLPNRKHENWKYTNLEFLNQTPWQTLAPGTDLRSFAAALELDPKFSSWKTPKFEFLSFINGQFQVPKALSLPIRPLSALPAPEMKQLLGDQNSNDYFENLNLAWINEGFVFDIPAGKSYDKPICIDFYYSAESQPLAAHPRLFINVGTQASVKLMFRTFGRGSYFGNSVVKINLAKESSLELVNLQMNSNASHSFSDIDIALAESANLRSFNVSLGGKLNRENLHIRHQGRNSTSNAYGVYLTKAKNQSDHYTNIEHLVGHCQSQQLYKGLLADESRAVFNGRVFIAHGAAKASSEQLNNNLLLSSQAEIDSKPQLEILADDVKATHGSTVGQLDAEEIFYLQSRGIPKARALQLLAQGFAHEIISQVQDPAMSVFLRGELDESFTGLDL